jgi:hypothetical protein
MPHTASLSNVRAYTLCTGSVLAIIGDGPRTGVTMGIPGGLELPQFSAPAAMARDMLASDVVVTVAGIGTWDRDKAGRWTLSTMAIRQWEIADTYPPTLDIPPGTWVVGPDDTLLTKTEAGE